MTAKGSSRRSWTNSDPSTRPLPRGSCGWMTSLDVRPHELIYPDASVHPDWGRWPVTSPASATMPVVETGVNRHPRTRQPRPPSISAAPAPAADDKICARRRQLKWLDRRDHGVNGGKTAAACLLPELVHHGGAHIHRQDLGRMGCQWQADLPGARAEIDDDIASTHGAASITPAVTRLSPAEPC